MAKTYVNAVKYLIKATFEIKGVVDKPDIIGAIFGQSEGLLGDQMDLRELQNAGKVGRIDINLESEMGVTKGEVQIPSSMDMVQTSLLAAAVETVDKVGPFESKFAATEIQDTRNVKRAEVESRAKELLQKLMQNQMPQSGELAAKVKADVRTAGLIEIGPEKISAGPDVEASDSIILVEGRADVVNLLKNNIRNAVAMEGSKASQSLIDLCKNKVVTLFVDGDRGGELNARRMLEITEIDFIAKAPDGKEVEELAQKEILACLKHKSPANEFFGKKNESSLNVERANLIDSNYQNGPRPVYQGRNLFGQRDSGFSRGRSSFGNRDNNGPRYGQRNSSFSRGKGRFSRYPPRDFDRLPRQPYNRGNEWVEVPNVRSERPSEEEQEFESPIQAPIIRTESKSEAKPLRVVHDTGLVTKLFELKGSFNAVLMDSANKVLMEAPVRGLSKALDKHPETKSIVFDGIITQRLVDAAGKRGVLKLVGIKKGKITNDKGMTLITPSE